MNGQKITLDLSALPQLTNTAYYPLYQDETRNLVLIGGAGSGKSVFAIDKHIFRILTERNHRFLFIRKVARTIRNSIYQLTLDRCSVFGLSNFIKANKSDFTISFPLFKSEIIFTGLDDSEKIKSITGITGVFIEEASELTEDEYKQLNLRLRGLTPFYKQIVLATNPVVSAMWIKKRFIDSGQAEEQDARARVIRTTYRDNRFLDPEYIRELEAETDPYFKGVYTDGEFASLRGVVFSNVRIEPFNYVEDDFSRIYTGMDFGSNSPYSLIKAGIIGKDIYVLSELYGRYETNSDWMEDCSSVLGKADPCIADSEAPDKIREFQRKGWNRLSAAVKGKGSVRTGIDWLKRYTIHVNEYTAPNLAREIQEYKYAEDRDGTILPDPVKKHDHAIDALRYAFEPLWNKRTAKVSKVSAGALGL